MGVSLAFVPIGIYYEPRVRAITIPALVFVFLYSFLPHKELRFIIYVFPLLTIAAACACQRLWDNRNKSVFRAILACFAGGHLLLNIIITVFLLLISGTNYPGGVAMSRLHRIAANETNVSVHISNLAAQSGVSRFTEINSNWIYSKEEHLEPGDSRLHNFTYLLIESKSKYSIDMKLYHHTHDIVEYIDCFNTIGLQYQSFFPVKVKTKPCIGILRRKKNANEMLFLLPEQIDRKNIENDNELVLNYFPNSEPLSIDIDDNIETNLEFDENIDFIKETDRSEMHLNQIEENLSKNNEQIHLNDLPQEEPKEQIIESAQRTDTDTKNVYNKAKESIDQSKKTGESARSKLKHLIESHYRSKGSIIEFDKIEAPSIAPTIPTTSTTHHFSAKSNIKRIIKSAKIMELVDKISKLNLNDFCDLERQSTKECLKKIIDDYDVTSN